MHLLPNVYNLYKEAGSPVKNFVHWTHDMNKALLDIHKKWVFVLNPEQKVLGFLFYRLDEDGKSLYIDALRIKKHQKDHGAFGLLMQRFQQDDSVKGRKEFFASREIQRESSTEILAAVGLQDDSIYNPSGYESLGSFQKAVDALKLRYQR